MSAPPLRTVMAGAPDNATAQAWLLENYDYVTSLLGGAGTAAATAAEQEAARAALGIGTETLKNKLINPGGGLVYQRAIAATADDTYFADRWYALTQTGTVLPSVLADPENGYTHGVRITQSQATAQRFGYAQIIEGKNCKRMRGSSGVFAPRIRTSAAKPIRYAILGWTGTEDLVTSDMVNDWTSASFAPGGFFLSANVSVLAVSSHTPAANTWTTLPSIYAALGSTFNNIIVMVWTEGVEAQNFTLDFDWHEFNKGAIALPADDRGYVDELMLCRHHYLTLGRGMVGATVSTTSATLNATFPVEMMASPTVTQIQSGFDVRVAGATSSIGATVTSSGASSGGVCLLLTRTSGTWTTGQGFDVNDNAIVALTSEL